MTKIKTILSNPLNIVLLIIILLLLLSSLAAPIYKKQIYRNWKDIVKEKTNNIETEVLSDFEYYKNKLLTLCSEVKNYIEIDSTSRISSRKFIEYFTLSKFDSYIIEILDKDSNLIAWTPNSSSNQQNLSGIFFEQCEAYFSDNPILTSLSISDTIKGYHLNISYPIEKKYKLNSEFYEELSWVKSLSRDFNTLFEIYYSPLIHQIREGQKHSFPIYNNFNNRIATVTFNLPSRDLYIANFEKNTFQIQSLLLIVLILLLFLKYYIILKSKVSEIQSIAFLLVFLTVLRLLLYYLQFPLDFINHEINNPAYFSSKFAYGLVSSPLEFFITSLFLLFICLKIYKYFIYRPTNLSEYHSFIKILFGIFITVLFLFLLRGLGATLRSVIFDSAVRYFKLPEIIPDIPAQLMLLNVLITGYSFILISLVIIKFLFGLIGVPANRFTHSKFFFMFVVFQIAALIFDIIQRQPQGTPIIRISCITILFTILYFILVKQKHGLIFHVYYLLSASLITISLLIFYNSDFEKRSLKITANEILRSDENLVGYLAVETIQNAKSNQTIVKYLEDQSTNFNSLAFNIWSNSALEREALSSNLNIISTDKKLLGSFAFQYTENYVWDWNLRIPSESEIHIKTIPTADGFSKVTRAIAPIYKNTDTLAYIEVSILLDFYSLGFEETPEIFSSSKTIKNTPININQIKIFDFHNGRLVNYFTDLILSDKEAGTLIDSPFNKYNEAWINIDINDVKHVFYVTRIDESGLERILAVGLEEKDVSWNLFDFFKLFFIHSLYIAVILGIMYFLYFKKAFSLRYSFRTKLLAAFLLVSIIPLILLAVYLRSLTESKNTQAIFYKLGKRADSVEDYLNNYSMNSDLSLEEICSKATLDLGINFALFSDINLEYTSQKVYTDAGLIPVRLNSKVYKELVKSGLREFVVDESIDNYTYHSFYHKANINNHDYLIKVSDLFNTIQLPMTGSEVDIFLFGSYSFAIILVVILSTFLANQISLPIRKLTFATKSVGSGDLNVEISETPKGEISELVNGFNSMVKELKRNQVEIAEMEREAAWKEMAKQVAHEIKNPLTPMRLSIQQLITAYRDKSTKFDIIFEKVSETLIKQIDTLKNIASEFSAFARMPRLNMQELDVVEIINTSANLFINEKIDINIQVESAAIHVNADEEQLQRTMVNLIRNSIQAGANKINISTSRDNSFCYIRVVDDGFGISMDVVDRIFDESFTTKTGGMGLGLSMARRFIESINGTIKVEKTSEDGTTIFLSIPLNH